MKLKSHVLALAATAAVGIAGVVTQVVVAAPERPAALQALEKQGVTIVGTFPAPGGLTAWAGYIGQRPLSLFVTPDGKHVIAGTLLDAQGEEVAEAALEKTVRGAMTAGAWSKLESSHWIEDGKKDAPRTVYVFTDPNCPYCNKFWADARPWVDSGKVVLRHVMVGILTPTSAGKAAALLAAKDPAAALSAYERGHMEQNGKSIASGRVRPLADAGLKPLEDIPADIERKLTANHRLMASLGLQATPAMVWRDANGAVQMRTGAPPSEIPAILGPR
ncbi:MAG TPA: thiol:disulfide interchange protein DsbG [Aquabacterium sp.]|jgi:thiol:disulfide interchange protein DsbG|uniref:thiol:disulfide interchange protein DsbG n=1 Tax=Comamonadaceae TaxID=80864 RepID=UPI0011D320C1|nr:MULTISPECIES: thiol:disulfide interchange protein DsbG [Comamonadaceae]MBK8072976.1 thiol:disulfide interchange protein DsbG [Ramlibacter sp.]MBP6318935.1 thiol:disulfide interchange protein DsbG [Rubrivivax sp.]MBS0596541.1 thiol:disulfide interchange protein DsbG [Pseudomonadota bacterium]TXH50523.1 MAG: thiol:disulfide interchange protein DsbG [Burkholderiaceae bacterium]HQC94400.1 thiol:disulfide interchange protein DsbG [Aquabacterium sp.]